MVESVNTSWKSDFLNDANFEQNKPFDFELCVGLFEECGKDLEKLNPYLLLRPIWEITKAFKALSSALSIGFSDITTKVQVWRDNIKKYYGDANSIQEVIEKEIELNLVKLNGENNTDLGHKKKTEYHNYTSSTRTLLRLSWFLDFFNNILKNTLNLHEKAFSDCIKISYDKVLAPHHPWLVRKGAAVGISMAPSKREKAMKALLGKELFDEDAKLKLQRWSEAIEVVWAHVHNIYVSKSFLELP